MIDKDAFKNSTYMKDIQAVEGLLNVVMSELCDVSWTVAHIDDATYTDMIELQQKMTFINTALEHAHNHSNYITRHIWREVN